MSEHIIYEEAPVSRGCEGRESSMLSPVRRLFHDGARLHLTGRLRSQIFHHPLQPK